MKEELINQFKEFLKEHCGLPNKYTPPIKMSHGSCCCCITCGQYHDECVCEKNYMYEKFEEFLNSIK